MTDHLRIREYRQEDQAAILHLLRLNTPEYFSHEEEQDLLHYLDQEIEKYYVVESSDKIIGCGGINFEHDKHMAKISWDILHPAVHGQGTGTLLLRHRLDLLEKMSDVKTIIVRTSQMAYKFYEKNGFELREVKKDYWAKGFDLYKMEYKKQKNGQPVS